MCCYVLYSVLLFCAHFRIFALVRARGASVSGLRLNFVWTQIYPPVSAELILRYASCSFRAQQMRLTILLHFGKMIAYWSPTRDRELVPRPSAQPDATKITRHRKAVTIK